MVSCKNCEASRRFFWTAKRFGLFERGEPLLVAVSGGVDSVSLLHLLLSLPPSSRPMVTVVHFNHRLRGDESDRDADFVKNLCRQWNVPCQIGLAPRWRGKSNLQERAREFRYRFFKKKAVELYIRKVVTAHHADDQSETFLIRWLQGAGLKGLSGIRLKGQRDEFLLLRPLLFVSRYEIERYARHHRIPFREDATNRRPTYLRNRIRRLISSLRKENPNLARRASLNALLLQTDQDLLEAMTERQFGMTVKKSTDGFRCVIKAWKKLDPSIRYRLLQKMVRAVTSEENALPAEAILKMEELLLQKGGGDRYDLPHGIGFAKEGVHFKLFLK